MPDIRLFADFMKDFWPLIKEYYLPDKNPDSDYWQRLIADANALGKKHDVKQGQLAAYLINAFLKYLDEKGHER